MLATFVLGLEKMQIGRGEGGAHGAGTSLLAGYFAWPLLLRINHIFNRSP